MVVPGGVSSQEGGGYYRPEEREGRSRERERKKYQSLSRRCKR